MLGVSAAIGAAWGVFGLLFFATVEGAAESFFISPWAALGGFACGLVPIFVGVVYLVNRIDRHEYEHCALAGLLFVLALLAFLPFADEPTSWTDIAYYLVVIPASLASCYVVKTSTQTA
jgi:hypothetical protein